MLVNGTGYSSFLISSRFPLRLGHREKQKNPTVLKIQYLRKPCGQAMAKLLGLKLVVKTASGPG
jgi:hypothetical protein